MSSPTTQFARVGLSAPVAGSRGTTPTPSTEAATMKRSSAVISSAWTPESFVAPPGKPQVVRKPARQSAGVSASDVVSRANAISPSSGPAPPV